MAKTPLTASTDDHAGHHVIQPIEYIKTFLALTVLMVLTIAVALWVQVPDLGIARSGVWLNNLIAIGIATAKALLVIYVFMGVKYSTSLTKMWVAAGFIFLGIMFFILADHFTRRYEPAPGWTGREGSALPRQMLPMETQAPDPVDLNIRPRW
jgi:cytochrome c oxidase subunit IV